MDCSPNSPCFRHTSFFPCNYTKFYTIKAQLKEIFADLESTQEGLCFPGGKDEASQVMNSPVSPLLCAVDVTVCAFCFHSLLLNSEQRIDMVCGETSLVILLQLTADFLPQREKISNDFMIFFSPPGCMRT